MYSFIKKQLHPLFEQLQQSPVSTWLETLDADLERVLGSKAHGDWNRWQKAVEELPAPEVTGSNLNTGPVTVECDCDEKIRAQIETQLRTLIPWRKGPYLLHGVHIDTEWRSDLKWDRLADQLSPLEGRTILDVGCGNGYHCRRMIGAGAKLVIGIDPSRLFLAQHFAVSKLLGPSPCHVLPFALEDLPGDLTGFDTVFSMGVLYHRRSPIDHIFALKNLLRPKGELVLETIVIDEEFGNVLVPGGRYAKMRNVWFIPSCTMLKTWLKRCGFTKITVADVTPTTIEEQRTTDWMRFESLPDFLDPQESSKTIEGYPAPQRAVLIARA